MIESLMASDESLARAARAGDSSSFESLVARYHPRLVRFVASRLRDVHAAEDVTQAAFVSAWRALHGWNPERPFSPWLFAVLRSRIADHLRRRMREPPSGEEREPAHASTPALAYAGAEDARSLWEWMRGVLNERQHTALWLHYQENFSVRDAATSMEVTETHFKVLLHRARSSLHRKLLESPVWRECLAGLATPPIPFTVPLQERSNTP